MTRYLALLLLSITLYSAELKIGYSSMAMEQYKKQDMMISIQVWIEELIQGTGYTTSIIYYDDSSKMSDDMNSAKLDLAISYGLEFVKYFDRSKLSDGFSGALKDTEDANLIILASKEKSLASLKNIANPTIAILKGDEISEIYIKNKLLKDTTINKQNINFLISKKYNEALLKLFFKKVDAAVVTKQTFELAKELNPQIGKKLKIIEFSNIPSVNFAFFRADFDEKLKKVFFKIAFNMNKTPRGKQIMTLFHSDVIVKKGVEDLEPIQKLYEEYINLNRGIK